MIRTTLEEASLHLEELIDAAVRGEEVIITAPDTAAGEKVVRLVPNTEDVAPRRKAGSAKGLIHMRDDFEDPLPDFDEYQ
jgi:antitoxin (DNA-binding transcriptional repressor) of toxin-antitoxin stability system